MNETESTPATVTPAYVALDPAVIKPMGSAANAPSGRKRLVIISRTTLIMLFIAALAVLGMGVLVVIRGDPPEVDGWLRYLFGRVFGVVALGLAVVLGVPSAIGLWAMAGSTAPDAVPALPETPRRILAGVAAVTVAVTALVLLVTGSAALILNLGLLGIVGLAAFGLAGAVAFSPHRWRAIRRVSRWCSSRSGPPGCWAGRSWGRRAPSRSAACGPGCRSRRTRRRGRTRRRSRARSSQTR